MYETWRRETLLVPFAFEEAAPEAGPLCVCVLARDPFLPNGLREPGTGSAEPGPVLDLKSDNGLRPRVR